MGAHGPVRRPRRLPRVVRADPARTLFAVLDTDTGAGRLAGLIGLLGTSAAQRATEIGPVWTLPPFQRTHVTTHAVGLLLRWLFEECRLRRVQWQANIGNVPSVRAAERMGFRQEMVRRWERSLPPGKGGLAVREEDPRKELGGRHTALLSICWDEWSEVSELVKEKMDRR